MQSSRHMTTRRGFITAFGFGGVSLYALWAAYGAAPNPFKLMQDNGALASDATTSPQGAMEGHGGMAGSVDVEAFRAEVAQFVERFAQDDGTVYPRAGMDASMAQGQQMHGMSQPMDGMGSAGVGMSASVGGHSAQHDKDGTETIEIVDLPILAERWYFEPGALRLDVGKTYRFRMMTADIAHGASIQLGSGSRMIRLSPGSISELEIAFERPGEYLVYCTSYCGTGHDGMQARIVVA